MTFDEFVSEWKVGARQSVSDGWKICQDQVIRDHIMPYLGSLKMNEITPSHISKVIEKSKIKRHSINQQNKIYNVMSKIFRDAIEFYDYLPKSPVRKKFHRPRLIEIEQPHMNPEQSIILLEYVLNDSYFGMGVWIQLLSGIRISELQALQWQDFDWSKNVIKIRRAFNKHTGSIQGYTKNKLHYRVPISPLLRKFLFDKKQKKGRVVMRLDGEMFSSKSYDQYIKRISKKLCLPIKSSHGLRHSCSKLYESKGASDEQIQKLLGHKHLSSTKTYIHRTDEKLMEVAKKIA